MSTEIKAKVHMISGCQDRQTSADVSNVESFQLPDPAGRAGGACTSALLRVLYADQRAPEKDLSFQEVLLSMRAKLREDDFEQVPQLSSSRMLDIQNEPFSLAPAGTKRAVLIGINYVGQNGELSGCHNDVWNMKNYIMDVHGVQEENITILLDDGNNIEPNRENIMGAYRRLVNDSESGDSAFCHYSGHGGKLRDDNGDEEDGYDETLVPLDYANSGQIRDDDLFITLVQPMAEGVNLTCLMDSCHSGTVLDLPYKFVADGESDEMQFDESVKFDKFSSLLAIGGAVLAGLAVGDDSADVASDLFAQCCTVQ